MKKTRKLTKLTAILTLMLLCMGVFCTTAFALEGDVDLPDDTEVVVTAEPAEGQNTDISDTTGNEQEDKTAEAPPESESAIPTGSGFRPFTPPGTGTVVDNATDGDGKEFYTIMTEAGDVFYLIIDRQRNTQNVYFLNAVTELDLLALAVKNEREVPANVGAIPNPEQPGNNEKDPPATSEPGTEKPGGINPMLIVFLIAVGGVGGAAYYFMVIKKKKNASADEYGDNDSDDDEYGYDDETENGEDDFEDGGEGNE